MPKRKRKVVKKPEIIDLVSDDEKVWIVDNVNIDGNNFEIHADASSKSSDHSEPVEIPSKKKKKQKIDITDKTFILPGMSEYDE